MSELLNKISSNNLILLCVIMSVIALFLAVAIAIELFNNYKRKKRIELLTGKTDEEVLLNIKEDENVTYVEDDEELEKTKAKIELAKLKERLKKEEDEKKKLLELNLALASKENTVNKEEKVEENVVNVEKEEAKPIEVLTSDKEEVKTPVPVVSSIPKKEENILPVAPVKTEDKKVEIKKTDVIMKPVEKIINEVKKVVKIQPEEDIEILDVNEELNIRKYEDEEEANAIISYDELKKNAATFGYTDEEMNLYVDEKDAIISIQELEKLYHESNEINSPSSKVEQVITPTVNFDSFDIKRVEDLPEIADADDKKFQSTPFISPIHGVDVTEESILLEQTANLEKLNEEIKKTNEFLKTLKELKKNLQ